MNSYGTPMNPIPQQMLHKRLPPKILPLKYKLNPSKPKINSFINALKSAERPYNADSSEKSPQLPIICIKKNNVILNPQKLKYSKNFPKFHIYKPLFHDRNKSYIKVPDEDEDYISMKNKFSYLDY